MGLDQAVLPWTGLNKGDIPRLSRMTSVGLRTRCIPRRIITLDHAPDRLVRKDSPISAHAHNTCSSGAGSGLRKLSVSVRICSMAWHMVCKVASDDEKVLERKERRVGPFSVLREDGEGAARRNAIGVSERGLCQGCRRCTPLDAYAPVERSALVGCWQCYAQLLVDQVLSGSQG